MDLKQDQTQWRVFLDESFKVEEDREAKSEKWRYYELRGRYGIIYPYSADLLAAYIHSPRIAAKFQRETGIAPSQQGDYEAVFRFSSQTLPFAAGLIGAKKRRRLSPEQKARLAGHLKDARQARSGVQKSPTKSHDTEK